MPIGRIGPEFLLNTTTTNDQFATSLTALADGRFVVTWSSFDPGDGSGQCVRGRVFNADGSPSGNDFIVNSTTASIQQLPSVTALPDGRFIATWTSFDTGDGSGSCIRARVFNADGSPEGNDFIVNSTTSGGQSEVSVTALADGSFVATWESDDPGDGSGGCIRARVFDADGNPTGADFVVNTTTASDQLLPTVTALADGGFVVTWESTDTGDGSGECIRARVFDADGNPAGDDFIVNTTTTDDQVDVSVTALVEGGFVVTWESIDNGDGSGTCIRGRVFDVDGDPTGNDFIVNSTATNDQIRADVTALADGRFVVTWQSDDGGDGDGIGVRARIFNADGSPAGDDFIVNTTETNSQFDPSVRALSDGRFVITWTSDDPEEGSGNSVRAQIFDPTVFIGTAGADSWQGGNLADTINGGGSGDSLSGLGGDDVINGDSGSDTLSGGDGNDRLYGGTEVDILNGEAGNDTLIGNAGSDTLNGGTGADTMQGNSGDDTYVVDNAGDQAVETDGNGTDLVQSSVSFSLAGQFAENLTLTGSANINGTGNNLGNTITGNSGNNTLKGGGGTDTLNGGAGSGDTADYSDKTSAVVVTLNGATNAAVSVGGVAEDTVRNIENVTGGTAGDTLTGDNNANVLDGGSSADALSGGNGDDTLKGGLGADTLNGGGGSGDIADFRDKTTAVAVTLNGGQFVTVTVGGLAEDTMKNVENVVGGTAADSFTGDANANLFAGRGGNDTLTGAAGADSYLFNTALNAATNVDHLTDFASEDTIDLENAVFTTLTTTGTLAAGAFASGAGLTQAQDADDRVVYNTTTGALFFDADGVGGVAAVQFAILDNQAALTNADFLVV